MLSKSMANVEHLQSESWMKVRAFLAFKKISPDPKIRLVAAVRVVRRAALNKIACIVLAACVKR